MKMAALYFILGFAFRSVWNVMVELFESSRNRYDY